jgi:hypothetical protein
VGLGPNEGQARDFQLPDGGVPPQPLSDSELYDAFARAWSMTPADSLFGGARPVAVVSETRTRRRQLFFGQYVASALPSAADEDAGMAIT